MTNPVDSYTVTSGQPLYAGMNGLQVGVGTLTPSWLPSSGQMARVSLANIDAAADKTNPDPWLNDSDLSAALNAWCSTLWCPGYGPMGSIIVTGGGHGDRLSNAVFRYDVATRQTSRITNGSAIPIRVAKDYDTVCGQSTAYLPYTPTPNPYGEFWTNTNRDTIMVDQMAPTHSYGNYVYVPGAAVGNTNGYAVVMGNFNFIAHHIDLDNPSTGWHRSCALFTTVMPSAIPISYGCSVYDSKRKRIVSWPYSNNSASFVVMMDIQTRGLSVAPSGAPDTYYTLANYMVADDLYLVSKLQPTNGVWTMYVIDPNNMGTPHQTTQIGTFPPAGVLTFTWDEGRRQWVGWDAANANLWICQAPANPITGTWVWSQRSYTAQQALVLQTGQNHMFNRLHYSAPLDSFLCITRVDGPVQLWKV